MLVLRMSSSGSEARRILVAGIGNRLMGDDGFGPWVVDLLSSMDLPDNVVLRDFGTAGLTVATELEGFHAVIFIDSMDAGGEPGHLTKSELRVQEGLRDAGELARFTLHEVGLEGLLLFSKAIGTLPERAYLIGCVPKIIEPSINLSPEVMEAARKAVELVVETVGELDVGN